MGFKIQFDNGHTVEFESKPSDADIDEAYQSTLKMPKKAAQGGGLLDKAWENTKEIAKEGFDSFMGINPMLPKSASQEVVSNLGTGMVAQGAGLVPAGLSAINDMTQGKPANFEEKYAGAMDRMTSTPKTEKGQEAVADIGEFMNRNLVPLGPIILPQVGGMASVARMRADKARLKALETKPKTPDVAGAAADITTPPPADRPFQTSATQFPDRGSMAHTKQGELFPPEMVTEKINGKQNEVQPGAASEFNPFQEQTPFDPRLEQARLARQQELPFGDTPSVIRQDKRGVGTLGTEDPGLVEAVRRGAPEDVRVFEEMQQQLQQGAHSDVSTSQPRGGAMIDMASELVGQGRDPHGALYAEQRRGNELIKQDVEGVRLRDEQMALQRKHLDDTQKRAEAQRIVEERQREMELAVKRNQTLDFNAAERARQEKAAVPGMEQELARLENERQEKQYQDTLSKVENDSRVIKAEERARKAEELYLKAVEGPAMDAKKLKRLEKDMQHFQEAIEWVRSNVEYEYLKQTRKTDRIKSDTKRGRQRGAIDPLWSKKKTDELLKNAQKQNELESFHKSLMGKVKDAVSFNKEAVENFFATGQLQWKEGDKVTSSKTKKTYEITGHWVDKHGVPHYRYKNKDESGMFNADKAHAPESTLKKINNPFKGPGKNQAGAINTKAVVDAAEKLAKGAISAVDYLKAWKGAFDPRTWDNHVENLRDPKSRTTIVLMSPREFHRLAEPRGADQMGDAPRLHQNIRTGLQSERGLLEAPFLWLKASKDADTLQVMGHEGRHRMDVFRQMGIEKIPVVVEAADSTGIRWGEAETLPSKVRPQWVGDSAVLDMPMPKTLHDGPPSPHRVGPVGPGRKQGGWILLEGKKQKATKNLMTKLDVQMKLGEMSPSEWTPEQALAEAKKGTDLDQNLAQRLMNGLTKGGLYQSLKTHNPLVRYANERIMRSDRLSRAGIRDWVHGKLAPAMQALKASEQADLWHLIDLADLQKKPLDLELLAKRGFSEKQLDLAQKFRESMDHAYQNINRVRAAAGLEPIDKRVAYAAMRATGDYRRIVYDSDKNAVGVIGGDTRARVSWLQKQYEQRGYTVGEERYYGGNPRERGSANQAFMHAIEAMADRDPRVREFVDVLDQIRTTEVNNFLNMKTHMMNKKGVFGMEGRKPWADAEQNAKEGFQANLNYLEASIKWAELADAVKDIKTVLDNPDVNMPRAKQWTEDYMYNALGFNPKDLGRKIEDAIATGFKETGVGFSVARTTMSGARKITNAMLLGMNPRFWMTNVVQPFQSMPAMKAKLIAQGLDAGFDFGTGWSYIANGAETALKENAGLKMDAFEQKASFYAQQMHVYGSDMVEHSNRARKDVQHYFDKVSNFVAAPIESVSRRVMFYGFAHLLKENGMQVGNSLFETAHNLTDMAMNNYSTIERPQVYNTLGPVGDLAVNLQSYKHNELSRFAYFVREAKEKGHLRPVAAQLMASTVMGGILGLVAFNEADQLVKLISKHVFKKPTSLTMLVLEMSEGANKKVRDVAKDKLGMDVDQPYLLSHGVFSMMGLDLSRNLGLTDVIPDSPIDALFPGGSKLGEMAGSTYDFYKNPTEMNTKRLARAYAPIGAQGAIDNHFFTQPNGLAVNPETLKGQAYRNTTDKVAKYFAFNGINESVQRQKTYQVEKLSRDYADLRQSPLHRMRDDMFTKGEPSPEAVQEYLKYRGNLETLESDLMRYAQEQRMAANELALMRAAASRSVASMEKARDYMRMFKNENKR